MLEQFGDPMIFKIAGLTGAAFGLLGVILPASVYCGKEGEKYSFLNHYISELGERGVSRWAWVFNFSFIICGLSLTLASISLGLHLSGVWSKLGLIFGVITGLGLTMVGVFPMDTIKPHTIAALTFFRGGFLMVLTFSLAFLFPGEGGAVIPRLMGLAGVVPLSAFGYFLWLMWTVRDKVDQPLSTKEMERPRIWKFAVWEWAIYFSVMFWLLLFSLVIS